MKNDFLKEIIDEKVVENGDFSEVDRGIDYNRIIRTQSKQDNHKILRMRKGLIMIIGVVLLSIISIITISSFDRVKDPTDNQIDEKPIDNDLNDVNDNNKNTDDNKQLIDKRSRFDSLSLLGIAAVKEVHSQEASKRIERSKSKKVYVDETINPEGLVISYPYSYIKIHNAKSFVINISDGKESLAFDDLRNNCGLGNLEVIIADFTTYSEENGIVSSCCSDTLIAFKGSKGICTILMNSYIRYPDKDITQYLFSSHKRLGQEEITKDFISDGYSVLLASTLEGNYLSFTDGMCYPDDFLDEDKYFYDESKVVSVSNDSMYSILDLITFEETYVFGAISNVEINDNMLSSDVINIELICQEDEKVLNIIIDDLTLYNDEYYGIEAIKEFLLQSDSAMCKVSYYYLYDGYNPTTIYANSIVFK